MDTETTVWIKPDTPITCHMTGRLPVIQFGLFGADSVRVILGHPFDVVTQKAYLTNLARQIQLLAASIPVDDKPDDEPDAQVRSILGGAIA